MERLRKLAPPPPKDAEPDSSSMIPKAQPQAQPMDDPTPPWLRPPPSGAMPDAPGAKTSDASQRSQPAPVRGAVEIKPQGPPPRTPTAPAQGGTAPGVKQPPKAAPALTEENQLAALPNAASINLAKAKPEAAPNKASSTPGQVWAVQVASYAREADAGAFAGKLKEKGYNAGVVPGEVAGQARYRVEVGPVANREQAQAIQKELATVHKFEQAFVLTRWPTPPSTAQQR
jgi:cell division septation protein DedD